MRSAPPGCGPSFRRRFDTCVSMLRSKGEKSRPRTSRTSASRVTTSPADRSNRSSRSNSTVVEIDGPRPGAYPARRRHQGKVADGDHFVSGARRARGSPSEDRPNPRDELLRIERLRQVVVGAQVESGHPVHGVASRGEHDHRQRRHGAEPSEDLETVHAGHHHVQDDHCVVSRPEPLDIHARAVGDVDGKSFACQVGRHEGAQLGVIVDDEDPRRHAAHSRRRGRVRREELSSHLLVGIS